MEVEQRHERRPLAPGEEIGHAKVRDHGHAEGGREHRRIPDLHRHALSRPLAARIVEDGLAVIAEDFGRRSGRSRRERVPRGGRGDFGHLDVHAEELAQR
jgi:hypothetical protein